MTGPDTTLDVAALALAIRDGGRTMLRPAEEKALAERMLALEQVNAAAAQLAACVAMAEALNGAGDTAREVKAHYEALRRTLEKANRRTRARDATPRLPRSRQRPLRQLARWWRTNFFPTRTIRRQS